MWERLTERWRDLKGRIRELLDALRSSLFWWFGGISELPRQILALFLYLGRGLWFLLCLPFRLLQSLFSGLARAREAGTVIEQSVSDLGKSVRASAVDLRETVESQPETVRAGFRAKRRALKNWFLAKARWQQALILFVVGSVFLGAASAYPAWQWVRSWRATMLSDQAEELFAEGRRTEAFFKGQAAYFTDPENADLLVRLIDYSRGIGHPRTLQFGDRLLRQGGADSESLVNLTEEAQERQRPELARAFLRELERIDADNPSLPRLRIREALAEGAEDQAFELAKSAYTERPFDRDVFYFYFSLGMDPEHPARAERLRAELEALWREDGPPGRIAAIVLLDRGGEQIMGFSDALVDRVLDDAGASSGDRLFAMRQALAQEIYSYAALRDRLLGEFELETREGKTAFAAFLFQLQQYTPILQEIDLESVREDRVLMSIYVLSLLESGRANEGLDLVRSADGAVLPEFDRLLLEGRLLRRMGREEAFNSTIERAIARVGEEDFRKAMQLLQQLGEVRFLEAFYDKFSRNPGTAVESNAYLLVYAYRERNDEKLESLLQRTPLELLDAMPNIQGLLAYLRGLKNVGVPANIRKAEGLVARYPNVIDFRVALAVNYFQAGFLSDANAILANLNDTELSRIPGMFAVKETILKAIEGSPLDEESEFAGEMTTLERDFVSGKSRASESE